MIRFRADARLHDAIVSGCLRREPAIDFLSANEAKLEGVPDPEVLPSPQSGEQTHWASWFERQWLDFSDPRCGWLPHRRPNAQRE